MLVFGSGFFAPACAREHLIDHWATADGLPVNAVNRLLVGQSGYLWLATFDGLVRFDGHRFSTFSVSRHPELGSNRVLDLIETADGLLWLHVDQTMLVSFDGAHFRRYGTGDGLPDAPVWGIQLDRSGDLWVFTEGGGIARRSAEHAFDIWSADPALGRASFIERGPEGHYWVATINGLHRFDGRQRLRSYGRADGVLPPISGFDWDRSGRMWIAGWHAMMVMHPDERVEPVLTDQGVLRIEAENELVSAAGGLFEYVQQGGEPHVTRERERAFPAFGRERLLVPDADGGLWHNRIDRLEYDGRPVLSPPCKINDIAPDRSGAVWVATACDGIYRLRERHIQAITHVEGRPLGAVYGMAEDHARRLWLATLNHGVAVLEPDGTGRWIEGLDLPIGLHSAFAAPDGSVRIDRCRIGPSGQCAQPDELPADIGPINRIGGFLAAPDGGLFLGGGALWHQSPNGSWQLDASLPGLAGAGNAEFIRTLHQTRGGSLWLGTMGNGLLRRDAQGDWRKFGLEHGVSSLSIRALREDRDGQLWVATENRGLCRIVDPDAEPRIGCLGQEHGLWSDSLHQVLFDDADRVWINSNHGIFAFSRSVAEAVLDGRAESVHPQVFTELDGLADREGNGGVQDAGIRLADGRMAFPSQQGVVVFHPDHLVSSDDPPRVHIEAVAWPGQAALPAPTALLLPRGQRSLSLQFTGFSGNLTAPVYFRYRLHPDDAWRNLGSQRQLDLDQLAPGRYPLQLQAFDSAGHAGDSAGLQLHVPHFLYETTGFRLAALLALVLVVATLLWRQRGRARRRQAELETTVAERTEELRGALQEIEHLAASKTRFFANVSHELRTPLTLLTGPLDDLVQGKTPAPELAEAMARNASRLERLIGQLLDLERIEARRFPLRPEILDLARLVREAVTAFTPLAQSEGITLGSKVPAAPVPVCGDLEQVFRVVGNLLSNAVKFCPAEGHVLLLLQSTPSGGISLRVEDSGPGIPEAWRESIFDRFSQMGSASTRLREGAGLGLALCREVANLHGGRLFATDSALGGAGFVFELPAVAASPLFEQVEEIGVDLAAPDAEEPADSAISANSDPVANTRQPAISLPVSMQDDEAGTDSDNERPLVLLAEDHPDLRRYLAGILVEHYRVISAEDGESALQHALQEAPDLIVTDLMMPRLDGLGLAQAVRQRPELAGVPIVFLTARAADSDRIAGLAGGADYYLTKPFESRVLLAQLDAALRTCERLRQHLGNTRHEVAPPAEETVSSPFVERLMAVIHAHHHDPALDVNGLAQRLHMSQATLRRHCQAELSTGPGELLRQYRLEQARRLLQQRAGNVSEIAYAVGYARLASFGRAYREHFGHAPGSTAQDA